MPREFQGGENLDRFYERKQKADEAADRARAIIEGLELDFDATRTLAEAVDRLAALVVDLSAEISTMQAIITFTVNELARQQAEPDT